MNCTCSPLTGPSPPVLTLGSGLMPFNTELAAVNEALSIVPEKLSVLSAESRPSNAMSDGEFCRAGTLTVQKEGVGKVVRPVSEALRNTA